MPISMPAKTPAVPKGSFGRERPDFTVDPKAFRSAQQVGILCGRVTHRADVELLGLDRDGAMTWSSLEQALGPLPPTLSSKGDRHRFYWIPARLNIPQQNGFLMCDGGQIDSRPNAGGYFREPWEWDQSFDLAHVAYLPPAALAALRAPAWETTEPTDLPEPRDIEPDEGDAIISSAVEEFPDAGQGRHTTFMALGGSLRRTGVSLVDAEAIARAVAEGVGSDQPDARTAAAVDAWERCDRGESAYGRTTLRDFLLNGGPKTLEALDVASRMPEWMQGVIAELERDAVPVPAPPPSATPANAQAALEAFPTWVQDHVLAVKEELRTPIDLNIANALGALSAAISGRVKVRIQSGYTCHTCLFVCAVADSSERKSPAFHRATQPISDWCHDRQSLEKDELHRALQARALAENRRKALQTTLGKQLGGVEQGSSTDEHEELIRLSLELDAPPPVAFEFLVEDATPEALADLLAIHGRLACFSSDASKVFQVLSGRYSDGKSDLGVWLEAYDGRPRKVHRIGRKAEAPRHEQTTLAAVLSVQPSVLENVTGDAALVGEGLLPRFCWVVCPEPTMRLASVDDTRQPVPDAVGAAWCAGVRRLLELPLGLEAQLSPEAFALYQAWDYELECRMRGETQTDLAADMCSWAGKHLERTVRIAGVLWAAEGAEGTVTASQMASAVTVARWLIPHAVAALRGNAVDGGEAKLIEVVQRHTKTGPASKRAIQRHAPRQWRGDSKALELKLGNLVDRGLLILTPKGYSLPGH
jgi:hypothetical protein